MDSLIHALKSPFILFDRFIQKIVNAITYQIMWVTGWGKSNIRLIANIVALFFGVCLALSIIKELKGFHRISSYAILFVALMRAVTAQGDYRMDVEAEKRGMRSQADLGIIKVGWHGRAWFWFVAFFQGYISVYVPTTFHRFFFFFNGYITTWIWMSYFAHTPPAPPSRRVKVPKTVLTTS